MKEVNKKKWIQNEAICIYDFFITPPPWWDVRSRTESSPAAPPLLPDLYPALFTFSQWCENLLTGFFDIHVRAIIEGSVSFEMGRMYSSWSSISLKLVSKCLLFWWKQTRSLMGDKHFFVFCDDSSASRSLWISTAQLVAVPSSTTRWH